MIKEEMITVGIAPTNIQYYRDKGYSPKMMEKLPINAKDISTGSKLKITFICDYCGAEFIREVCSNSRSKKDINQKDSCLTCSRNQRHKETCLFKYGVDSPMKVESFILKCQDGHNNFEGDKNYTSSGFVNGIPVSMAQFNLKEIFSDFELNFKINKYFIDLYYNNVAIEYNGRGHDLEIRLNKISQEEFLNKEQLKKEKILLNNRLLIIKDSKDTLKNKNKITPQIIQKIQTFIESDVSYEEIVIS